MATNASKTSERSTEGAGGHVSGDPSLAILGYEDTEAHPPKFEDKYEERKFLKHRLVLAYRIFAQHGLMGGVAGHITMRDPVEPTSFWVNPFGLHFSLIKDDDLIRVSHEGKVVEGGSNLRLNFGMAKSLRSKAALTTAQGQFANGRDIAAFAIHSEIHRARPDVLCAAHSHSPYGRAMCATGRKLEMLTQDFCVFYDDHVVYPNFAGLVLAAEEGRAIAAFLGEKKAALLANHGLLTVGPSIEATVAWFLRLEDVCRVQMIAEAASVGRATSLVTIGDTEAKAAWEAIGTAKSGYFSGLPYFQVAEQEFGEHTYLGRGLRPI